MKPASFHSCLCITILAMLIEIVHPTCVLESDFGFKINCAFKKSGLFRVRNLGGIKAHASLGFSLGDELGFEQSLTNLDQSRRRSVSVKNGVPQTYVVDTSVSPIVKQEKRGKQNILMMQPIAPATRPNQAAMDKLSTLHRSVSSTMKPIVVPGPTVKSPIYVNRENPSVTMAKPLPMGVPPFRPLPTKEETLKVLPIVSSTGKSYTPLQLPPTIATGSTYQSENYPHISYEQVSKMVSQMTAEHVGPSQLRITPTPLISSMQKNYSVPTNINTYAVPTTIHPFVPMPLVAPPTQTLTIIPAYIFKSQTPITPLKKTTTYLGKSSISIQKNNPVSNFIDPVPHQVHDLASMYPAYNTKKIDDYNTISGYGDDTMLKFNKEDINAKIAEIAQAGNISMEAVEAAIALRQQQLLNKYANLPMPTTTTSTRAKTTTKKPLVFQEEPEPEIVLATQKPKRNPAVSKVMNAPKEYYPVGYEKNFDDHFQSKVDLPETNFHCGDQKYFPGLYGDESLGCMVFHVCALTDDGLVMKSFLCPESTLFDQTILKCNWWFYVDCKNTRQLYDTNIPVSKSYQLMKALTFFSSYKKEMQEDGHNVNPEDVEGIKEAISILENQDNKQVATNDPTTIQAVTPQPYIDERDSHKPISSETSPIYRGSKNYNDKTKIVSPRREVPETKDKSPEAHRSSSEQQHKSMPLVGNAEFKLVTDNADMSFNKTINSVDSISKETSQESISNRKHRRRMTLNNSTSHIDNQTKSSTSLAPSTLLTIPSVEQISEVLINSNEMRQAKLSDNLSHITAKVGYDSPPVQRYYRSSAENTNNRPEKEMSLIDNEKVQIIRPTSIVKIFGEHPTPKALIAKLDEAILGSSRMRKKRELFKMLTPQRYESIRSSSYRHQT